jgi:hypothetical protein
LVYRKRPLHVLLIELSINFEGLYLLFCYLNFQLILRPLHLLLLFELSINFETSASSVLLFELSINFEDLCGFY